MALCNAENVTDCFSLMTFWEVFNTADAGLWDFKRPLSKSSVGQKDCKITGKKIPLFSAKGGKKIYFQFEDVLLY